MHRSSIVSTCALALVLITSNASRGQLSSSGADLFVEDELGFYGPQDFDRFAYSLATGDFDGDGADDLATGVPYDNNAAGGYVEAGIVIVRYGVTGSGLATGTSWNVLSQFNGGSPNPVEDYDFFGTSLAAGDFNGDGFDDLAVGVTGDPPSDAGGAVQIHYGAAGGLDLSGSQHFHQDTPGVADVSEDGDRFGWALAVGDFDGDGYDDLAIGVVYENITIQFGFVEDGGAVQTLYGSAVGLSASRSQYFDQNVAGVNDTAGDGDHFGSSLAAGDFNADGRDDLAVGVRGENDDAGAVQVFRGSATGLTVTGNLVWSQNDSGIADSEEEGDLFGWSLAVGDFDHNAYEDLAIGVPHEDVDTPGGEIAAAGAVHVLLGGPGGLSATGSSFWTQDTPFIPGAAVAENLFGYELAAGAFTLDGFADLVIGVPGQDAGEGVVIVLPGEPATNGLNAGASRLWRQGVDGVPAFGEAGDQFGFSLVTGDFDGNGFDDLVIGAPFESTSAGTETGAEWALYGTWPPLPFADGFESGRPNRWSARHNCSGACL